MFGISKKRLVANLEALRQSICEYHPRKYCDCKFIKDPETYVSRKEKRRKQGMWAGEDTGCCEVRQALELIQATTEEEFYSLAERAEIELEQNLLGKIREIKGGEENCSGSNPANRKN